MSPAPRQHPDSRGEGRGLAGVARRAPQPRRSAQDLHICPRCDSEFVNPVEWAPVDMRRWRVELRCPECDWREEDVHEQAVLDRFDSILDQGVASISADLEHLQASNMREEVDRFLTALRCDHILPEDF